KWQVSGPERVGIGAAPGVAGPDIVAAHGTVQRARAGQAGTDAEGFAMLWGVMVADDPGVFRAGTDERHFPAEHVPELRQLVDLQASQEIAERKHARVGRSRDRARRRPPLAPPVTGPV